KNILKDTPRHITDIIYEQEQDTLKIDINSRINLELDNNSKSRLLSIIGKCKTSLGSRLLKRYFSNQTRHLNILATRQSIKNILGENQQF
ncbi:DNA mismatch repair protein MutS, partial [Francisella tularensis subsp. holarctica]|nr:DNA mismatch repair protein MutS [Francisella tularensis subsp. holarctica]